MAPFLINATRLLAGISVPDTPIINSAITYARVRLPDHGYNHVMRAWLNGQAIINNMNSSQRALVDEEAFAVAAILHDLGWSNNTNPPLMSNDKIFEVDGAIAARDFIQRETGGKDWNTHRQQLVWDSIALHGIVEINKYKETEALITAAGTVTDVFGIKAAQASYGDLVTVTPAQWERFNTEFPRIKGMGEYFRGLMVHFCTVKPQVTWNNPASDYGEKYVPGYSRMGHRPIDTIDIMP